MHSNGRGMAPRRPWGRPNTKGQDRSVARWTNGIAVAFLVCWLIVTSFFVINLVSGHSKQEGSGDVVQESQAVAPGISRRFLRPDKDERDRDEGNTEMVQNDRLMQDGIKTETKDSHGKAEEKEKLKLTTAKQSTEDAVVKRKLTDAELHGGWNYTKEIYDLVLKHPNAEVVHWDDPRIILVKNFLSPDEVDHMKKVAESGYERSIIVSEKKVQSSRTSEGSWLLGDRRTDIVKGIEDRISSLTGIPNEFSESLHVLRYHPGQKYDYHTDHCHHTINGTHMPEKETESCQRFLQRAGGIKCGPGGGGASCGDRIATIIMYLETPVKGGETAFPKVPKQSTQDNKLEKETNESNNSNEKEQRRSLHESEILRNAPWYCKEDANVLKVRPNPGDAVVFYGYKPGNEKTGGLAIEVPSTTHSGCPPIEGDKIIATRWMRAAQFN